MYIYIICILYILFIYVYKSVIYILYIYIYIYNRNNVPSRLSPQSWLCGNSCTWARDERLHIPSTKVLNKPRKEHNISGHK